MLKLSGGSKESNPVDLLAKSRPSKKPKPKKEVKSSEKKGSPSPKEPGDQTCYRCLGNHDHKSCPFKKEKCHHCNKTGHIVRAWKSKKRESQAAQSPVNYVDSDDGDSDDYLGSLEANNVSDKDHVIWVSPEVQGRVREVKELTLQVVETPGPALFGRDWLSKIQLNSGEIKPLKHSKTLEGVMQCKVDQLLQQYESVFSEGVGTLKGHKADLNGRGGLPA